MAKSTGLGTRAVWAGEEKYFYDNLDAQEARP